MAVLSDQIRKIRFNLQRFRYHGSNQSFSLLQPSTVSFPISCKNWFDDNGNCCARNANLIELANL